VFLLVAVALRLCVCLLPFTVFVGKGDDADNFGESGEEYVSNTQYSNL
jgi:hypothetical protein